MDKTYSLFRRKPVRSTIQEDDPIQLQSPERITRHLSALDRNPIVSPVSSTGSDSLGRTDGADVVADTQPSAWSTVEKKQQPQFFLNAGNGDSQEEQDKSWSGENVRGDALDALKKLIRRLDTAEEHNGELIARLEAEHSCRSELERLRRQCSELEGQHHTNTRLLAAAQEQAQKSDLDCLLAKFDRRQSICGLQASDSAISNQFRQLLSKINRWSQSFYAESCSELLGEYTRSGIVSATIVASELRTVSPGLTNRILINDRIRRCRAVNGWVWCHIMNRLLQVRFASMGEVVESTVGETWKAFLARAGQDGSIEQRSIQDWRVLTAQILYVSTPSDTMLAREAEIVRKLAEEILSPMVSALPEAQHVAVVDGLTGILRDAVHFARVVDQQRAVWSVRFDARQHLPWMDGDTAPYDPRFMDDWQDEEGHQKGASRRTVSVFVAPGLFKRGNNDGDSYDTEDFIAKVRVQTTYT